MYKPVFLIICLFLLACSAREYHVGMLNETTLNSRQAEHIQAIQTYDGNASKNSSDRVCYTYPPAMGSFTTGCQDLKKPEN